MVAGLPAHGPAALPLGRLGLEGPGEALLRDEGVLRRLLRRPPSAWIQILCDRTTPFTTGIEALQKRADSCMSR